MLTAKFVRGKQLQDPCVKDDGIDPEEQVVSRPKTTVYCDCEKLVAHDNGRRKKIIQKRWQMADAR